MGDKICPFSKPVTNHQSWWKVHEIGVGGMGADDNMCISTHMLVGSEGMLTKKNCLKYRLLLRPYLSKCHKSD